jgi:hypothetical protein
MLIDASQLIDCRLRFFARSVHGNFYRGVVRDEVCVTEKIKKNN